MDILFCRHALADGTVIKFFIGFSDIYKNHVAKATSFLIGNPSAKADVN